MRVLLHICCAPCAIMPKQGLLHEGMDIMGFFYNPNIHPFREHSLRLTTLQGWALEHGLQLIVHKDYDPQRWFRQMAFRESMRCGLCYHMRLTRAAQVARRGKFDAFTSTLLYSKRQKHELIAQTGQAVAAEQGVPFLYRDWRVHWQEGIERCQDLGLYRQPYCGCLYSEHERFGGPLAASHP